MESWNNHSLSSEGNKTPYQLFFEGLHHMQCHSNYSSGLTDDTTDVDVSELTRDHVTVPRLLFIPCHHLLHDLNTINPLQPCSDNATSLYRRAIERAGQHLSSGCNQCSQSE